MGSCGCPLCDIFVMFCPVVLLLCLMGPVWHCDHVEKREPIMLPMACVLFVTTFLESLVG